MGETVAGMGCVALAILVLSQSGLWGLEVSLLIASGLAVMAAGFFCAPLMAAMAIRHAAGERRRVSAKEATLRT